MVHKLSAPSIDRKVEEENASSQNVSICNIEFK
jgi:hypothetical protein